MKFYLADKTHFLMENVSGNIFDKIGLGDIAPHVKSGLDDLDPVGKDSVLTDIMSVLGNSNGNFLTSSKKVPPLGEFQEPSGLETLLSSKRMAELNQNLKSFYKEFSSEETKKVIGRFQKISILLNMIKGLFDNFSHFDKRASASNFSRLKL